MQNKYRSILNFDFATLYPTTMKSYSMEYLRAIDRALKIKQILKKLNND